MWFFVMGEWKRPHQVIEASGSLSLVFMSDLLLLLPVAVAVGGGHLFRKSTSVMLLLCTQHGDTGKYVRLLRTTQASLISAVLLVKYVVVSCGALVIDGVAWRPASKRACCEHGIRALL